MLIEKIIKNNMLTEDADKPNVYTIPVNSIPELRKKINAIQNKGAKVIFNILKQYEKEVMFANHDTRTISVVDVEVSGEYKINGWEFVGTIEHSSPNIIRIIDDKFEGKIPLKYRTCGPECEHCHLIRDRKDTYLVYNEETKEFKQVGKTCLQSYTNGLNAEVCAEMVSLTSYVHKINAMINQGGYSGSDWDAEFFQSIAGMYSTNANGMWMPYAKKVAYALVSVKGYKKEFTKDEFLSLSSKDNEELLEMCKVTDQQIQEVEDWLMQLPESGWVSNAKGVWNKEHMEGRDAGLLVSIFGVYFNNKEKELAKQQKEIAHQQEMSGLNNDNTQHNVGDRVTLKIINVRIAYSGYSDFGEYSVYRIIGDDGNIYVWSTTTATELKPGYKIMGTVKGFKQYKDENQTVLTRVKVIDTSEQVIQPEEKKEEKKDVTKEIATYLQENLKHLTLIKADDILSSVEKFINEINNKFNTKFSYRGIEELENRFSLFNHTYRKFKIQYKDIISFINLSFEISTTKEQSPFDDGFLDNEEGNEVVKYIYLTMSNGTNYYRIDSNGKMEEKKIYNDYDENLSKNNNDKLTENKSLSELFKSISDVPVEIDGKETIETIEWGNLNELLIDKLFEGKNSLSTKDETRLSKYLWSISGLKNQDVNIKDIIDEIKDMGFDPVVDKIEGWTQLDDGYYKKDYFFTLEGYDNMFLVTFYCKGNGDWDVTEVNARLNGKRRIM